MPQSNKNNNNKNNSSKNNNNNDNSSNNNNTTSASTCNISPKDRVKISREYKKIKCLDTLAKKYKCSINQIEKIVKEKKKKTRSTIKANSYLVSLLDKVVYEWFQRAQRLIETGTITDEMFIQKAHESKQIFGITDFPTDYEWVCNFRKKYNITNLDMILLRIENDNRLLSVDINDIVMFVLKNNPITEYLPYAPSLQDNTIETERDPNPIQYLICYDDNNINETIISDNLDEITETTEVKSEILPSSVMAIASDEQAIRHLKPLEDYALLKENFRAIGLIAQLEEIFATEINQQKIE